MKNLYSFSKGIVTTTTVAMAAFGLVGYTSETAEAVPFGTTWDTPGKPEYQVCVDLGAASCDLQDLLDAQTVFGGIDADLDQTGDEWFAPLGDSASASFMFEVAGFSNKNVFGIYNSKGDQIELFGGTDGDGDSATVTFNNDGSVNLGAMLFEDFGNEFGFYLTSKRKKTFFSQSAKNPGGLEQAVIYQGDDTTVLDLGEGPQTFTNDQFIVAFEDLSRAIKNNSDSDFNDLVVLMGSIESRDVPEPSTLLGLGLLGASFWSVRRRRDRI